MRFDEDPDQRPINPRVANQLFHSTFAPRNSCSRPPVMIPNGEYPAAVVHELHYFCQFATGKASGLEMRVGEVEAETFFTNPLGKYSEW